VRAALAPPKRPAPKGPLGRFFGVFTEARAYTSLFFMLLSLATGIVYFVIATTGLAISAGLMVLIIGLPFFLLFLGLVRVLALAEGRLVEALTGTRMPRRPVYAKRDAPWYQRIGDMLKDRHTWLALLYMLIDMPLGTIYFVLAVVGLALGVGLIGGSIFMILYHTGVTHFGVTVTSDLPPVLLPLTLLMGVLVLTGLMHLAKGIGIMHSHLAKALLVRPVG
jgi:hypothetical protein